MQIYYNVWNLVVGDNRYILVFIIVRRHPGHSVIFFTGLKLEGDGIPFVCIKWRELCGKVSSDSGEKSLVSFDIFYSYLIFRIFFLFVFYLFSCEYMLIIGVINQTFLWTYSLQAKLTRKEGVLTNIPPSPQTVKNKSHSPIFY